jgi:hypothetical protein
VSLAFAFGSPGVHGEEAAQTTGAVQSAVEWLTSLRGRDTPRMAALSHVPFVQRGFNRCPAGVPDPQPDLSRVLDCIAHSDEFFIKSIPENPKRDLSDWHELKVDQVAKSYRKVASTLSRSHSLVGGGLQGDGVSYDVAIAVDRDGKIGGILMYPNLAE